MNVKLNRKTKKELRKACEDASKAFAEASEQIKAAFDEGAKQIKSAFADRTEEVKKRDRERLIELIRDYKAELTAESFADYLIANGVCFRPVIESKWEQDNAKT